MRPDSFDHAPLVESWLKEPVWLPKGDIARVGQLVHQTPQQRRGLPQIGIRRFQPMFSATKLVVGGLIVALSGGFVLSGVLPNGPGAKPVPAAATAESTAQPETTTQPDSTAATDPSDIEVPVSRSGTITLPHELPEGSSLGTIETAAGPVRWVRLSGPGMFEGFTEGALPDDLRLVPWDEGIAAWVRFGDTTRLWSSSDGIDWAREALPASGELGVVGETALLVSADTGQAWTREFGGDWEELDASAIVSTRPASGWEVTDAPGATEPTGLDGRIVFGVTHRYKLSREQLGIPVRDETNQLRRLTEKRYALCGKGACYPSPKEAKRKLRFDETTAGLRVTNERTGKILGVIAGADASELYDGHMAKRQLSFAVEGTQVVPADVSWEVLAPQAGDSAFERRSGIHRVPGAPDWLAEDYRSNSEGLAMQVGDEWVSLAAVGLDGALLLDSRTPVKAARVGNLSMIATDVLSSELDVWLLFFPEGT